MLEEVQSATARAAYELVERHGIMLRYSPLFVGENGLIQDDMRKR